jgi:hypothetical protein
MTHRRPLITGGDSVVLIIAFAATVGMCVAWDWDHRAVNNALSVLCVSLMCWRLLGTWYELTMLEHALVLFAIIGPLTAVAASLALLASNPDLPNNPALWLITLHRLFGVVIGVWWRRWLGRRHSPLRRSEA